MRSNIVIHIGAAKTGSSAIQAFLRKNHIALADLGFIVPDRTLGLTPSITGEHVWAIQERINIRDIDGIASRLASAAELAGAGKTLVLSAENLSNLGNHRYLQSLSRIHNVKIIVYIRRQDELLTSAWQQWHCKVDSDFQAWLLQGVKIYGHWDRLATDWEGVVGEGNVNLRIFERDELVNNDLLQDFVDALGLRAHRATLDFDVGVVNPSFSDLITPLIAGNTRIFEDVNDNKFFNFLLKVGKDSFTSGKRVSLISKKQRDSIIEYYKDINQRVCVKHFSARSKLFSAVVHDKYNYVESDLLVKSQLQLLTELLFRVHQNLEK